MIQSVQRTFQILEYMSAHGRRVRLQDIAVALDLHKTTVHNLLKTLKTLGYVAQEAHSPRYYITEKVNRLGFPEQSLFTLKKALKPIIENLATVLGETTYLATQHGNYFRYELEGAPHRSLRIVLELGRAQEMAHTAIGKVFTAYSPQLPQLLTAHINAAQRWRQTADLQQIRAQGYALDLEVYEPNLNCVAVPYLHQERILAVVGVAGPAFRLNEARAHQVAREVQKALAQVTLDD